MCCTVLLHSNAADVACHTGPAVTCSMATLQISFQTSPHYRTDTADFSKFDSLLTSSMYGMHNCSPEVAQLHARA